MVKFLVRVSAIGWVLALAVFLILAIAPSSIGWADEPALTTDDQRQIDNLKASLLAARKAQADVQAAIQQTGVSVTPLVATAAVQPTKFQEGVDFAKSLATEVMFAILTALAGWISLEIKKHLQAKNVNLTVDQQAKMNSTIDAATQRIGSSLALAIKSGKIPDRATLQTQALEWGKEIVAGFPDWSTALGLTPLAAGQKIEQWADGKLLVAAETPPTAAAAAPEPTPAPKAPDVPSHQVFPANAAPSEGLWYRIVDGKLVMSAAPVVEPDKHYAAGALGKYVMAEGVPPGPIPKPMADYVAVTGQQSVPPPGPGPILKGIQPTSMPIQPAEEKAT